MKLKYLAFSEQGEVLARRIAETLGGEVTRSRKSYGSYAWTADNFRCADGLVYVGASGIAVRSIAPHLVDKAHDPAVIVIDERGNFVISLVSGHLGGANDLARRIAALIDGLPVITTATDVNGVFAVDAWARVQGCHLLEKERILGIATRLLTGKSVRFASPFTVGGEVPDGIQVIPTGEPADICLDGMDQTSDYPPGALKDFCKKAEDPSSLTELESALIEELDALAGHFASGGSLDETEYRKHCINCPDIIVQY